MDGQPVAIYISNIQSQADEPNAIGFNLTKETPLAARMIFFRVRIEGPIFFIQLAVVDKEVE